MMNDVKSSGHRVWLWTRVVELSWSACDAKNVFTFFHFDFERTYLYPFFWEYVWCSSFFGYKYVRSKSKWKKVKTSSWTWSNKSSLNWTSKPNYWIDSWKILDQCITKLQTWTPNPTLSKKVEAKIWKPNPGIDHPGIQHQVIIFQLFRKKSKQNFKEQWAIQNTNSDLSQSCATQKLVFNFLFPFLNARFKR